MNAMDMLPVDWLPWLWGLRACKRQQQGMMRRMLILRVVPTADLSAALGMSVSVLLITIYYNIKIKGLGGWAHELVTAPFGSNFHGPVNFVMQLIEYGSNHGRMVCGCLATYVCG